MVLLYIIRGCCYLYLLCVHNGCGAPFSIAHDLDCCSGGLITCRLNEIEDAFGILVSLVSPVIKEPIVYDGSAGAEILIAGLCLHGVWEPQTSTSALG